MFFTVNPTSRSERTQEHPIQFQSDLPTRYRLLTGRACGYKQTSGKMKTEITAIIFALAGMSSGYPQGFLNLNFESATIPSNPTYADITVSNLFPRWTVTAPLFYYNDVSLTGNSISIWDTNPPAAFPPIQGRYFAVFFGGNYPGFGTAISLGQTGQIPLSAQSLIFLGAIGGMQINFNGQPISFFSLSATANYTVYGADISPYAGQTGQLLFTLPPYVGNAMLDNIQFSSSPIPEPGVLCLFALGGALLGVRRWKK